MNFDEEDFGVGVQLRPALPRQQAPAWAEKHPPLGRIRQVARDDRDIVSHFYLQHLRHAPLGIGVCRLVPPDQPDSAAQQYRAASCIGRRG